MYNTFYTLAGMCLKDCLDLLQDPQRLRYRRLLGTGFNTLQGTP